MLDGLELGNDGAVASPSIQEPATMRRLSPLIGLALLVAMAPVVTSAPTKLPTSGCGQAIIENMD